MAKKKVTLESIVDKLDKMDTRISSMDSRMGKGFSAVSDDMAELKGKMAKMDDEIVKIKHTMLDQYLLINGRMIDVDHELRDVRRILEKIENAPADLQKEIDHSLERIGVIEKHVGIKQRVSN